MIANMQKHTFVLSFLEKKEGKVAAFHMNQLSLA